MAATVDTVNYRQAQLSLHLVIKLQQVKLHH
jgi:hypothetical protein